jgi:ankyrin repeat protein
VEEQNVFLESLSDLTSNIRGTGTARAQGGTCEWIFKHKCFDRWLGNEEGNLLFLLGPSGCGKTILSNFISKRLKQEGKFVTSFYCKDTTGRDRTPPVIETFIYRFLNEDRRLFRHVPPKYRKRSLIADLPRKPEEAWEIFESILEDFEAKKSFLFLDGLDECDEAFVNDLLKRLESIFNPTANNMVRQAGAAKIMLTCKPRWSISECASRFPLIDVGRNDGEAGSAQFVMKDIGHFVRAELRKIATARNYSEELKNSVESKILSKASGMFLWTSLVLEELRNGRHQANKATVERIVDTFPITMDRYYSQTLESILQSSPEEFKQILQIVLFAARPLSSRELAVALAIRSDRLSISELKNFVDDDIINWISYNTGGLLKVNEDTCELVHFSFQEFLESISHDERVVHLRRFEFHNAASHLDMARRCMYYLMLEDFQDLSELPEPQKIRVLTSQPFLLYAIDYWPHHIKLAGDLIDLEHDLLTRFLRPDSPSYRSWDCICRARYGWRSGNPTPLLHYIAEFGLMNLLNRVRLLRSTRPTEAFQQSAKYYLRRKWFEFIHIIKGNRIFPFTFDIDKDDDTKLTALDLACMHGKLDVVNHLLDIGAWSSGTYVGFFTPFQIALEAGHKEIALRILEEGTNLTVANQAGNMARPIHYACSSGLLFMVKLIYALAEVDLNEPKSTGETPLYLAIENNHIGVVSFLLDNGATPQTISAEGPFPLHLAVQGGKLTIADMLLNKGAEFDAYNEIGFAPIHYAAAYDYPDIIRLLKDKGANVNLMARTTEGEADGSHNYDKYNALHIAVQENGSSAIRALIGCGGDVNAKNKDDSTVLEMAAARGDEETLQLLLNAQSLVNEPDAEGYTPLYIAAQNGHLAIVRSLLKRGADPDISLPSSKISPLHTAVWNNHIEVARELLQNSADVEARTVIFGGWTPLFPAAHKGHSEVVQLLIDFDANPRAVMLDTTMSVLETAVSAGHCDTAKILMDNGATVRCGSAKRLSALHRASIDGRVDIVKMILDREKSAVDLETKLGDTPLSCACNNGHDEIAETLLNAGANSKKVIEYGITIFHIAAGNCKLPLVKRIMQDYPKVDLRTDDGYQPIHFASFSAKLPVIEELLLAGADIRHSAEAVGKRTPLHQAALGGNTAVCEFIIGKGEDVNIQDDSGVTPIHLASEGGFVKAVKVLLEHHADPTILNGSGRTPLHRAAFFGRASAAEALIDAGVPIDQEDEDGATAVQLAIGQFIRSMVILLFKRGASLDSINICGQTTFDMALAQYHFSQEDLAVVQRHSLLTRRKKSLNSLLSTAKAIREKDSPWELNFSPVTTCLQLLQNYYDAQLCLQFRIDILPDGRLQHRSICNICCPPGDEIVGIIGYRYRCTGCFDIDLCETHMEEYEKQGRRLKGLCHGHSFFRIPEDLDKFDIERHKAFGDEQKLEWLRDIEYRYAWERHISPAQDSGESDIDWPSLRAWLETRIKNVKASKHKLAGSPHTNSRHQKHSYPTIVIGLPRFVGLFCQEPNVVLSALRLSQRLLQPPWASEASPETQS